MKPQKTVPKVPLPIKNRVKESPYEGDQATSDTSLEYDEFELSCDEYIEIFNKRMRARSNAHCFDVLPKIFSNSYTFKKRGVLSTLDVFKPRSGKRHPRLMSMNFNPYDLRENPSQEGRLMRTKLQANSCLYPYPH